MRDPGNEAGPRGTQRLTDLRSISSRWSYNTDSFSFLLRLVLVVLVSFYTLVELAFVVREGRPERFPIVLRLVFVIPESLAILVRLVLAVPKGIPILDRLVHELSELRVLEGIQMKKKIPLTFSSEAFFRSLHKALIPPRILASFWFLLENYKPRLEQRVNKNENKHLIKERRNEKESKGTLQKQKRRGMRKQFKNSCKIYDIAKSMTSRVIVNVEFIRVY